MNIHHLNGQKITSEKARQLGLSLGSKEGTKPARTRDGKTYPGGRSLRRSLGRLHMRRDGDQGPGHKQPDSHQGSQANWATKPGSMTH